MKKYRTINILLILFIILISALPMILFANNIKITSYSILAIGMAIFHLLHGFAAYCFRHKGNFLRFRYGFVKHPLFFMSDKDYTFTKEYEQQFNQMLAMYYSVVPMYIPCIFLTSKAAAMPIALVVFLIPQILFILSEIKEFVVDINTQKSKRNSKKNKN